MRKYGVLGHEALLPRSRSYPPEALVKTATGEFSAKQITFAQKWISSGAIWRRRTRPASRRCERARRACMAHVEPRICQDQFV